MLWYLDVLLLEMTTNKSSPSSQLPPCLGFWQQNETVLKRFLLKSTLRINRSSWNTGRPTKGRYITARCVTCGQLGHFNRKRLNQARFFLWPSFHLSVSCTSFFMSHCLSHTRSVTLCSAVRRPLIFLFLTLCRRFIPLVALTVPSQASFSPESLIPPGYHIFSVTLGYLFFFPLILYFCPLPAFSPRTV